MTPQDAMDVLRTFVDDATAAKRAIAVHMLGGATGVCMLCGIHRAGPGDAICGPCYARSSRLLSTTTPFTLASGISQHYRSPTMPPAVRVACVVHGLPVPALVPAPKSPDAG